MTNRQIIESIQRMAGTLLKDNVSVFAATVDSVNEEKRTCTVTSVTGQGAMTVENVQLMASVDDGFLLIPVVDSNVIVAYSTYNKPFIALFSGIEKVLLVAGENNASIQVDADGLLFEIADTKIKISDGEIKLNDGSMGGLVKVIQLTQKLNNLENKVNQLITAYNSHVHTGVTTGPGSSAITPSTVSGTLTPTNRGDIENEKIVHG
jgi:hypothetical protein